MFVVPAVLTAFFLGLNSGINYATLGATLTIYLNEFQINYSILGLLSLRLLPFSMKSIFAPVIDMIPISFLGKRDGYRKGWLIFCQLAIILCYLIISGIENPNKNLIVIVAIAFFAAIFGSIYDSALHGYRIDTLNKIEKGKSNFLIVFSFNIGFFISLSIGLLLSSYIKWNQIFIIYALILIPGIIILFLSRDAQIIKKNYSLKRTFLKVKKIYNKPFFNLIKKPNALYVIVIAMFFKASDAFMASLMIPYLLDVGFTKTQIFAHAKIVEFISISTGITIGGFILSRKFKILKIMLLIELFAVLTNLSFISFLSVQNIFLLNILSFLEGLISSMSNIIVLTFLSMFCNMTIRFTATFYAILESFSSVNRIFFSSFGGIIVSKLGWSSYLIFSSMLSIPTFIACYLLYKKCDNENLFIK